MAVTVGTPGAIRQPPAPSSFFGQGVSYPLSLNAAGRLSLSYGEQLVAESLISILQTSAGERAMLTKYGCKHGEFEPIDLQRVIAKFKVDVADFESRVETVTVDPQPGPGTYEVTVTINYYLKGQADQRTLTFPLFVGPQAT